MDFFKVYLIKDDDKYDISHFVQNVEWSGRRGSAARKLKVVLLDDPNRSRTKIIVQRGHRCIFRYNDVEYFRGIITDQKQSNKKMMTFTAHDMGIFLSNNADSFEYREYTAGMIFKDCCERFELPYEAIADTEYKIPELIESKMTAWDVITDALRITWESTGARFYVFSDHDKLSLVDRRMNLVQVVLEQGSNIESWDLDRSIMDTRTRLKLISSEGQTVAQASDPELENRFQGIFQDVEDVDEGLNEAQLHEKVNAMLEERKYVEQTLSLTAFGHPDVIAGRAAMVKIPDVSISSTMFIEEDIHEFSSNNYMMDLKLSYKME